MRTGHAGCAGLTAKPLVSVLMPMFNSARSVRDAIGSILRQTYPHWELLVLDDGSSDRSVKIAGDLIDGRVRVMRSPHLGLAAQLNRGVSLSAGVYCARMDADDVAYPRRLELQVRYLEQHPEIDLAGSSVAVFQSSGRLLGVRRTRASHEELCGKPWASIPMPHPTWMARRTWFLANPYRAEMRGMEDRELLARTQHSSTFGGMPEVLLAYREDGLPLKKQWIARRETIRHLSSRSAPGTMRKRAMLLAGQMYRLGWEAAASATGLTERLQRTRSSAATSEERLEFEALWCLVSENLLAATPGEV